MFGKKDIIVAWLKQNEIILVGGGKTEVQSLVLPLTAVADMEVVNRDQLQALVKEWAQQHPYNDTELVWIFDNQLCFAQLFAPEKVENLDTEVVKFLELLPFAETYHRVYDTGEGGKQIIAVNKGLYEALKQAFALQGYETKFEIPAALLPPAWVEQGLGKDLYGKVGAKMGELEKQRLEERAVKKEKRKKAAAAPGQQTAPKSQLKLLLAVFGVLLLVLGVVIWVVVL